MRRCKHGHGRSLCFECFKAGMERTRARRAVWEQKELPFDRDVPRQLSDQELAHRRRMLAHLVETARRA